MEPVLSASWIGFWTLHGAKAAKARKAYAYLAKKYSQPHRAYHNLDHIKFCLEQFDQARHHARGRDENLTYIPDSMQIAIWYHDIVYNTHRDDNEERSAILALSQSLDLLGPKGFPPKVLELILATKHNPRLTDPDQQLIADVDLAGFGRPWGIVKDNSHKIRREYSWVPEGEYIEGRRKVLQSFLDRPSIYYSPYFRDLYELTARENLLHEIERLPELARL